MNYEYINSLEESLVAESSSSDLEKELADNFFCIIRRNRGKWNSEVVVAQQRFGVEEEQII